MPDIAYFITVIGHNIKKICGDFLQIFSIFDL